MTEKTYKDQEFTIHPLGGDRWTLRMMTPRGIAGLGVFKSPDEAKEYAAEIGGVVAEDQN
jgi:hypothetical protein